MLAGIIYAVGGFIELVIGLRFVLRLLGADPSSSFVNWVYTWSNPLVAPFSGIFGQHAMITGPGVVATSVFDWTALIALIIYALVFGVIAKVFVRVR